MPDFVARYQLSGPPPQGWKEQLEKFAVDSGLTASASIVGNQAIIKCRVPENATGQASAIATAFFDEAAATLTSAGGGSWARLVSSEHVQRASRVPPTVVGAVITILGLGVATFWRLVLFKDETLLTNEFMSGVWASLLLGGAATLAQSFRSLPPSEALLVAQAAASARLAQEIAKDEDPKQTMRIEAARVSLRMRAGRMRSDADDLRERSVWAYRGALFFYLLSIAGPGTAAALLLNSATLDWHLMFGGFGLAAVPLTIGTALLRHDTKLREQYREAARDVATLERYELALDYARIGAQPSYDATLQQVITQLLTLPPATPGAAAAAPGGKEDGGEAAATAVATKLIETATSILGQKK